jgi:aryl-alcohol dehydrogenase-like predicted oxidoreductase
MSHDFPVIPIAGTKNAEHLADAIASTEVRLSVEQVRWLRDGH